MADEISAVTDSAPDAQAAPGVDGLAAEPTDATHGGDESQTTNPEQAADGAEDESESADDDEEESSEDQTEEEKTKAQKRRERRQAREEQRIANAVQERLTRAEQERATKAAAEAAEKQTQAAQAAFFEKFGSFVGTPETHQTLAHEIDVLTSEIATMRPYAEGTDLDVLEKKQAELQTKVGERARLKANADIYNELDAFQFEATKREYQARAATLPPDHQKSYLAAQTVSEALTRLEAGIVAREQAKAKAERDALESEWKSKLAREESAHESTRTGAPGAGPAPNGRNGNGGAGLTRETFLALPKEQKDKIRREQPGLVAEIYARSA